jgi:hypothetical protein
MPRNKVIPATKKLEVAEDIIALSISYVNKTAEVGTAQGEIVEGEFVPDMSTAVYEMIDFDELMAPSDGKPKGEFRKDDVFAVIDTKHAKKGRGRSK